MRVAATPFSVSSYTVLVSARDVADFASRWPCCNMPRSRGTWFQFDKQTGDLIDCAWSRDYSGALALCEDAMWFGADKLALNLPRVRPVPVRT